MTAHTGLVQQTCETCLILAHTEADFVYYQTFSLQASVNAPNCMWKCMSQRLKHQDPFTKTNGL